MRLRSVVLGAAVALAALSPALVPAVTGGAAACAADAGQPHAGLVIDTGGHATSYCVALDASSVSGIHLIELAGRQFGLPYRLGFGGQAVCQLNGVGPDGDDCFADYPLFWGYWHGSGDDGWSWASTGAGSARVSDGDRDGWSWGTGDSAATHAPPPAERFDQICAQSSPSPSPTPSRPPKHGGGGGGGGGTSGSGNSGGGSPSGGGGGGSSATHTPPAAKASRSPGHGHASPTPSLEVSPFATSSGTAAAGSSDGGTGGAPWAAVLAGAVVVVLVAAGALRLRAGRER
jgi:uncharacterized membrane protein YgcG